MQKRLIYLCGPITDCSYDDCTNWRDGVKRELDATGRYECLSPLRAEKYLKGTKKISCFPTKKEKTNPLAAGQSIVRRDLFDVESSQIILANFVGAEEKSIGSVSEIAIGWERKKFILIAMEKDNCHMHPFIVDFASLILPDLKSCVRYLKEIL